MFKHILVATDGSALADKALALALQLAATCGEATRVTALMVTPDYGTAELVGVTLGNGPPLQALRESHAAAARRRLDALLAQHPAQWPVEARVVVGDLPYEEIVKAAAGLHCDLIVIAARSRGALAAALLGSQTARVLALATVPVLVVK